MNELRIAFANVKKLFKNNTIIAVIIISSIMISIFGILFYSGYFLLDYYSANSSKESMILIQSENETDRSNIEKTVNYLNSIEKPIIMSVSLYPDVYTETKGYSSNEARIIGKYDINYNSALLCGDNFSILSNTNEVLVDSFSISNDKYTYAPIGEEINIYGNTFKIKGIFSPGYETDYIVPISYYATNFTTKSIIINFSNCSNNDIDLIKTELENLLKSSDIICTKNANPLKSIDFLSQFFQILLIFCISFLCIFLMINFWVAKMKQTFSVYAVCGCTPKKKMRIIMIQLFMVFSLGTVLGFSFFISFLKLLGKLNLVSTITIMDYVIIVIIVLIILCFYSLLFAIKKSKEKDLYIIEV